jgi:hypothetical protein
MKKTVALGCILLLIPLLTISASRVEADGLNNSTKGKRLIILWPKSLVANFEESSGEMSFTIAPPGPSPSFVQEVNLYDCHELDLSRCYVLNPPLAPLPASDISSW